MVQKARIRLTSTNKDSIDGVCTELREIADRAGVKVAGPIPLPTKRLVVPTRKSPCGEGTHTWDHYEMRIHKRLLDIDANERVMRRIMRIKVPDNVYIEMTLV
ncbi:MAG: 30S ribosomal protein S10 [Candidatus Bathyarchaeota archaeon]